MVRSADAGAGAEAVAPMGVKAAPDTGAGAELQSQLGNNTVSSFETGTGTDQTGTPAAAMTVTAAQGVSTASGMDITVLEFAVAALVGSQIGVTVLGIGDISSTITPATPGSIIVAAATAINPVALFLPYANMTGYDAGGSGLIGYSGSVTAPTPATPVAVTTGWQGGSGNNGPNAEVVFAEILPTAVGGLGQPVTAFTPKNVFATSVTTPTFIPLKGTLLVVLISSAAGSSSMTMNMSDSVGLTWVPLIQGFDAFGTSYSGIFIAQVPGTADA
jgi:hypothetical protein